MKVFTVNNKQYMVECKATQVPYTIRNTFLADSYIFFSSYPAILCIILIASYIAI